jgi:hypothetical protein
MELYSGQGVNASALVKELYTPQKDDTFVVAANTPFCFCVWSARKNITLVFINPHGKYLPNGQPYMSPDLFATWFVRTGGYFLDLNQWPNYAYYLWVMVQMNALTLPNEAHAIRLSSTHAYPFQFHNDVNNVQVRDNVAKYVQQSATRGRLRYANLKTWHTKLYGESFVGYGPLIKQILSMQVDIRSYLSNPRSIMKTKHGSRNDLLQTKILEVLQCYSENPEVGIEFIIKNLLY